MNTFIAVQVSLRELAKILDCEYSGNGDQLIRHIGDIHNVSYSLAKIQEQCIYFVESEITQKKIISSQPVNNLSKGIYLTNHLIAESFESSIIASKNIRLKFIQLLKFFEKQMTYTLDFSSSIHKSAQIGDRVKIAPGVYIGEGVEIGNNCTIHPNAVIEPFAKILDNSIIHSGVHIARHCNIGSFCTIFPNAVIGSDGFGYNDIEGKRYKIPQIGNVEIKNNVEIGACTTIDRGTIESTDIGNNTKIDNQVQVAHNCHIGENVFIAGKASLAGSVIVQDRAILAGGCGIRDHVTIARDSIVLAFTGIEEDTEPGKTYFGIPARKAKDMHRINYAMTQLPEMVKTVKKLANPD
ncbi:MAG: UDP-3-O-(3-hydroxymyristoyl)glucosamine N-acyltransferase [Spirochaetia bacterium]|nr:UDP-3-O-(3-hydroxymyristoyl)glucosamine N-acyltransferase [Spirochaetia bacterium]